MTIGERAYKAISDRSDQEGVGIVAYAKSIGISQPNLSHWKNAHSEPRAYLLSLMVEAGLDVHWILTGQRVDKVEVVRCEKCLYRSQYPDESGHYKCGGLLTEDEELILMVKPDFFCPYGERRSDNAAV